MSYQIRLSASLKASFLVCTDNYVISHQPREDLRQANVVLVFLQIYPSTVILVHFKTVLFPVTCKNCKPILFFAYSRQLQINTVYFECSTATHWSSSLKSFHVYIFIQQHTLINGCLVFLILFTLILIITHIQIPMINLNSSAFF